MYSEFADIYNKKELKMRNLRVAGSDFEEIGVENDVIKWESDDSLRERVMRNDFKKIYSLDDVSRWINYGLKIGVVNKGKEKEEVEMMMKWIDLLGKGGKNISV